ncbi:MAG: AAA family ATPase [Paludibacteraceae bacterium]|nr:AAA family ATPase [Paludibacteraceae bacterium]
MLEQFIKNRIIAQLPFEANKGQLELLDKLSQFIVSPTPRKAFILRGYAGTGKTSIMAALVHAMRELKQQIVLLAPTGRAAKVLSKYAQTPAYTIHKYIYRVRSKSAPSLEDATLQSKGERQAFSLRDNLHKNTLFIVDEASMISGLRDNPIFGSGMLLEDLVRYVYGGEGCSMLVLGDDAQLPPVGSNQSPALNSEYMTGYQLHVQSHVLTEVARQASDSGILENATRLRPLALGCASAPSLEDGIKRLQNATLQFRGKEDFWDMLEFGEDVQTVSGADLLEVLEQSYNEVGEEETILLTRTNKRTNIYNQGIRARILWREDEISSGDRLMVCKNNYFWTEKYEDLPFLANGDMLEVVRLRNEREMYGYHFVDAQLRSLDYDWEIDVVLWIDTMHSDNPEANQKMQKDLFYKIAEDYLELQNSRKKLIETIYQSPYYNALQVRMAYAITGHKSQGGQWQRVFIDPNIGGERREVKGNEARDFYRWLYTAITRATKKVYFIKNK